MAFSNNLNDSFGGIYNIRSIQMHRVFFMVFFIVFSFCFDFKNWKLPNVLLLKYLYLLTKKSFLTNGPRRYNFHIYKSRNTFFVLTSKGNWMGYCDLPRDWIVMSVLCRSIIITLKSNIFEWTQTRFETNSQKCCWFFYFLSFFSLIHTHTEITRVHHCYMNTRKVCYGIVLHIVIKVRRYKL